MAYSFYKAVHLQLKTIFGWQTADFGGKYYPQCHWKKKEKNMAAGQLFSFNLIRYHLEGLIFTSVKRYPKKKMRHLFAELSVRKFVTH